MTQALPPEAAGMVFRRCRSPSEQRAVGGLLAGRGSPLAERGVAGTDLFGLWDLTAPAGEALAGAAATGPLGDGGEVQLRGIAVAAGAGHQGLGRRLVCEVADSLRARGAARLVARPAGRSRWRAPNRHGCGRRSQLVGTGAVRALTGRRLRDARRRAVV